MDSETAIRGTVLVGRFRGVQGDQYPQLAVEVPRPDGSGVFVRKVDFLAFNARTGQPTPVGKELENTSGGDLVAVGLYIDVSIGTDRNGKHFPVLRATSIRPYSD